jgi:transaldolase
MLFLDSSEPAEIRSLFSWGVLSGVTTNPLILARELGAGEVEPRLREVIEASKGPVSVELLAEGREAMLAEAEQLRALAPERVCVKVPFSEEGLAVAHALSARGAVVNLTCMMSFPQAYLAALTGAAYVSLFCGRIRDMGYDAWSVIRSTRAQLDREGLPARIIAGSIRQASDVTDALSAGAHVVTVPPAILRKLLHNPKTDETIAEFAEAFRQRGG